MLFPYWNPYSSRVFIRLRTILSPWKDNEIAEKMNKVWKLRGIKTRVLFKFFTSMFFHDFVFLLSNMLLAGASMSRLPSEIFKSTIFWSISTVLIRSSCFVGFPCCFSLSRSVKFDSLVMIFCTASVDIFLRSSSSTWKIRCTQRN